VPAPEVASIGNGDSQIPQGPAQPVPHHTSTVRLMVKRLSEVEQIEERATVALPEPDAGDY
ncbi:MAG: hypothetical protein VX652_04030, partial [Candidatus Thermoplasmatota archaeon]|nr:hypothetical protein [Candidatus Thermoplasmatota archaeon]